MTTIAIDPDRLGDRAALTAEVVRYSDWVKGSPPQQPGGEVLLPGEVEHRTREERRRDGLPVDDATLDQILAAGEAVGLERAAMLQMLAKAN